MSRYTKPRRVSKPGESGYCAWIRKLKHKSGVYVIRKQTFFGGKPGKVIYIGESHTGKLYETLTRHFQGWDGPQSHTSYDRETVWVSVKVTTRGEAIDYQDRAIKRLKPRDNVEGIPQGEDTSFNFSDF